MDSNHSTPATGQKGDFFWTACSPGDWCHAVNTLSLGLDAMAHGEVSDVHIQAKERMGFRLGGLLLPKDLNQTPSDESKQLWMGYQKKICGSSASVEEVAIKGRQGLDPLCVVAVFALLTVSEATTAVLNVEDFVMKQWEALQSAMFRDFSIELPFKGSSIRIRVATCISRDGLYICLRRMPMQIMPLDALGFSKPTTSRIASMSVAQGGIFLTCGRVNSGKSSTLASMVAYGNSLESRQTVIVGQPIEYRHPPLGDQSRAMVCYREVGVDTPSFEQALIDLLRADAQCVEVSEIRDMGAANAALQAALAGHLVFASIHASSTFEAIDRFGEFFQDKRNYGLSMLSRVFNGALFQLLLPSKEMSQAEEITRRQMKQSLSVDSVYECLQKINQDAGSKRVLIYEYMEGTDDIRKLMRMYADQGSKFRVVSFEEELRKAPHESFDAVLAQKQGLISSASANLARNAYKKAS